MPKPIPPTITRAAFENSYWHRSSLVEFCRVSGLRTSGTKSVLTARITAHLSGTPFTDPRQLPKTQMPGTFTLATRIQPGWTCSQPLRAFFQSQTQQKFHFTKALRDFIATAQGRTLAEALAHWQETRQQRTTEIAPQFEYNRFLRHFHESQPRATRTEAITAWKAYRDTPISERPKMG